MLALYTTNIACQYENLLLKIERTRSPCVSVYGTKCIYEYRSRYSTRDTARLFRIRRTYICAAKFEFWPGMKWHRKDGGCREIRAADSIHVDTFGAIQTKLFARAK